MTDLIHIASESIGTLCGGGARTRPRVSTPEGSTCVVCQRLAYLQAHLDDYKQHYARLDEAKRTQSCADCTAPTARGLALADNLLHSVAFLNRMVRITYELDHPDMQNDVMNCLLSMYVTISGLLGACEACALRDGDLEDTMRLFYARAVRSKAAAELRAGMVPSRS